MRDYSFGNFLHELRVRRGLTQYQLGALVGVSDKAVSKWESGSSKPKSGVLYSLSEILGISVDELLSCKYYSLEMKGEKGVFAMKKQLWEKAFDAMSEKYGDTIPMEITNRFLTEQAEMQNTDMIVYFDFISTLAHKAKKMGEHIRVKGGIGASLTAYLLGATEVNPLKPHYYCTGCHAVIFDTKADDGWDLPTKKCGCGKTMVSDGHDIPFESYLHTVRHNTSFNVSMTRDFLTVAKSLMREYFKDCNLSFEEREESRITTVKVVADERTCSFTFFADEEFERYRALELATSTSFDRIDYRCEEVLEKFQSGSTEGIVEFQTGFMKNMIKAVSPVSFRDLIQIMGLSHGTGVWTHSGDLLIEKGYCVGELIAYRDDVFNYIQKRMIERGQTGTGFAYKIMEDTRRGIYAKNGVPKDTVSYLKSIGMDEWFVDSIGKIRYLFQKSHGVVYVKLAMVLMWYKIHYPKQFSEIML